ncbi:MAG: ABC transporter ATP-binding protein [Betaproteobacteria bacterium]|nr:ABC transporter ATP-binding protein [Betaproteobacteria bacterium]
MAESGLHVALHQDSPIPLGAEFGCEAGELLALVGPSGSGKSTILRCIAGLFSPQSGKVRCHGEVWLDSAAGIGLPPQARSVGLVFQHYALFPHLTALGNVVVALGHLANGEREKRARELLELVHLHGLEARRPRELSGGQQQRVALARALARDPQVLLLDEPFSAVDQATRRKLQRELAQLRKRLKIPIVLVTHDLDEARALADRICILHRGQTLHAGPPSEIMARPKNALVARLIGLTNLFEGEVLEQRLEAGVTVLRWKEHALEARHNGAFSPRTRVCWVIPPENVILHRRDRPSRGERENPLPGVIDEYVELGEMTSVTILVDGQAEHPLAMTVPTHVARRNQLGPGEQVTVSLLAEGIHLMPWDEVR